jgi:putative ABC transport system ATP-binding protein
MTVLEARHVSKAYSVGDRTIKVLDDICLTVAGREFIVIRGSSGSGKTTLLTLLSGLDKPSTGRILVNGRDITDTPEDDLAPLRNRQMGFVFQSFHLVPALTALENVMLPAELMGLTDAAPKALDLLTRVGMAQRRDNFPAQLSGGEKQRIALCRAVINHPPLLFADEPTGNLDSENGQAVLDLLLDLKHEHGATLVLVTHSATIAQMADRILTLKDGRMLNGTSDAA